MGLNGSLLRVLLELKWSLSEIECACITTPSEPDEGERFTLSLHVYFKVQQPLRRAVAEGTADSSGREQELCASEGC